MSGIHGPVEKRQICTFPESIPPVLTTSSWEYRGEGRQTWCCPPVERWHPTTRPRWCGTNSIVTPYLVICSEEFFGQWRIFQDPQSFFLMSDLVEYNQMCILTLTWLAIGIFVLRKEMATKWWWSWCKTYVWNNTVLTSQTDFRFQNENLAMPVVFENMCGTYNTQNTNLVYTLNHARMNFDSENGEVISLRDPGWSLGPSASPTTRNGSWINLPVWIIENPPKVVFPENLKSQSKN